MAAPIRPTPTTAIAGFPFVPALIGTPPFSAGVSVFETDLKMREQRLANLLRAPARPRALLLAKGCGGFPS
jgi:hypothetical protein